MATAKLKGKVKGVMTDFASRIIEVLYETRINSLWFLEREQYLFKREKICILKNISMGNMNMTVFNAP